MDFRHRAVSMRDSELFVGQARNLDCLVSDFLN